jgi:hypothetical protein
MEEKMGHIQDFQDGSKMSVFNKDVNYSIQIKLMNLDWIIDTEQGKQFLMNLSNSENKSIFETESMN